jgi:ABC-type lipoprotein export system ATPase subunit
MLEIKHVSKTFSGNQKEVRAVRDISFTVAPKEMVAVQGPSGCGKTTLLLMCGALLRPTRGVVLVADSDLYSLAADERSLFRAANIGFVFQQFHLLPYLNVLENVLVANSTFSHPNPRETARELIRHFNLEHRVNHVPTELSVGERQRVALARALFNKPKLVLADEPTGNLDPDNSLTVLDALREYADAGNAVLLVTHAPAAAERAHRVLRMDQGAALWEEPHRDRSSC